MSTVDIHAELRDTQYIGDKQGTHRTEEAHRVHTEHKEHTENRGHTEHRGHTIAS